MQWATVPSLGAFIASVNSTCTGQGRYLAWIVLLVESLLCAVHDLSPFNTAPLFHLIVLIATMEGKLSLVPGSLHANIESWDVV